MLGLLLVALMAPAHAFAVGKEYVHTQDDLILSVDTNWAGCGYGGYYPVRIQVVNRGKARDLTFRFSGRDQQVPTAFRHISVDQNATVRFTLLIPCVGSDTYGDLTVSSGGRLLKALSEPLTIPDAHSGGTFRDSLLVISPTGVDCQKFEDAVTARLQGTSAPGTYYGGHSYYAGTSEDHAVVKPAMLPETWLGYSGLDIVAIPLEVLSGMEVETQTALLEWVHTGGTLLVYDVGEPANRSRSLASVLGIDASSGSGVSWEPAALNQRRGIANLDEILAGASSGGYGMAVPATPVAPPPIEFSWEERPDTFMTHDLMLGRVVAFTGNPFPGTAHDWDWLLDSLPENDQSWIRRNGISARAGMDHFVNFLIPSVKGIPVVPFLLLITLFAIVIGPLNYMWLWKQRRLFLLVVTIPLIAVVTSLALLGYSAVAHGFGTKARVRSLTVLDQKTNTAVALSRFSLFSGLAPSDGLWFSPETAVYPIWPKNTSFESGTIDWTEGQHLGADWLPSRTRTQFLSVEHRDERGRLEVGTPANGILPVTNGLEWGFRALIVTTDDGERYFGEEIPAGIQPTCCR